MASIPKTDVPLKDCTCEPTAEWREDRNAWLIRCTLTGPDGAVLPLFVQVARNRSGNYMAELESDQTNFNDPAITATVRRVSMSRLKFWGDAT